MVQVGRLAPGHSKWLPEVRSQKKLAPGSQSFPEPVEWAGETQKRVRVLLRARVERRGPLFSGEFSWARPPGGQGRRGGGGGGAGGRGGGRGGWRPAGACVVAGPGGGAR